jgi:hypothetical protein
MQFLAPAFSRFTGWLLLIMITALSLSPPNLRPETGTPHHFEHFAIFCATGITLGVGYNNKRGLLAAGLMLFAGAIELAQIFAPGRHARLGDFIVDALAASVGVGLSMLAVNFTVSRGRL